jgi:hypothetical protein
MRTFLLVLLVSLAGCAYQQSEAPPSTITLQKAMIDTVDALASTRQRGLELGTNFQLYACTVTAVFNVSATQTVDNTLAIQAGITPKLVPFSLTGSASNDDQTVGMRGNAVTVVLASDKCSPAVAVKGSTPTGNSGNTKTSSGGKLNSPDQLLYIPPSNQPKM